jgi:hypothetical protein
MKVLPDGQSFRTGTIREDEDEEEDENEEDQE